MAEQINLNATGIKNIIRSTFIPPKPFEHSFTCNAGEVIPAFATIEVMPHDTWKFKCNVLVRQNSASKHPTMGRIYYTWAAFYTPHTQVYKDWDCVMGAIKDAAWVNTKDYSCPQLLIKRPIQNGHLLDHFGWQINGTAPSETNTVILNALKLRHYVHIVNNWLRDPNIEAPYTEHDDDTKIMYVDTFTSGGEPYKINRMADYFSTALPEPQRGDTAILNLSPINKQAPIKLNSTWDGNSTYKGETIGVGSTIVDSNSKVSIYKMNNSSQPSNIGSMNPASMYADTTGTGSELDISMIRKAAITQQILELDARAGARAPEMLWARWGVEPDDLVLQVPRLLCSEEKQITINQVPQTSVTSENGSLGELAAFGYGANEGEWNTFSFKYWGCLMILFWIRTEHKYQYGIPREDLKFTRYDFWHPEMDGEGDQPIYDHEIYATSENIKNKSVFGYQQRGAEYKMFPSIITGELRSTASNSLDTWHFGDEYNSQPVLSYKWMKEFPNNVDRTLVVTSSVTKQFIVDFSMEMELTRAMRAHAVPGIDRL